MSTAHIPRSPRGGAATSRPPRSAGTTPSASATRYRWITTITARTPWARCGLAPNDTIGVAPCALWIADNSINQSTGAAFDADVIAAFQWFSDPDGNPLTLDDVPDVVQNSWGVNEGFQRLLRLRQPLVGRDRQLRSGRRRRHVVRGERRSGRHLLRSPADRAATALQHVLGGRHDLLAALHHRGLLESRTVRLRRALRDEARDRSTRRRHLLRAAGRRVPVTSGTSMAGPHVAGVVALMRAANPDVDVETVKQILVDTAVDLGTPGEDNTYGHGFLNAYDAVLAVLSGYGRIEGTVTDAVSSASIPGVAVDVLSDPRATTTNGSGFFGVSLPAGSWSLEYSAFGYLTDTQTYQVVADQIANGSLAMTPAPSTTVSGVVRDFTSAPVNGAAITVLNTPVAPVLSLADGSYSVTVPDGATHSIRARKNGFGADTHTVAVSGPTTQDFVLPELHHEDFESGNFLLWPWVMSGNLP